MIGYIKGKIIVSRPGYAIIETSGVGYRLSLVKDSDYLVGSEQFFFVYEHIREDTDDLYGFPTFTEMEIFEQLITVNGVGPKAAMAIIGIGDPERILQAISSEDVSFFTGIPGIGQKVAAKIILELKSKMSDIDVAGIISSAGEASDVVGALVGLGYKKFEISKALARVPVEVDTAEEKIRWCLKHLAK
ncbi:MAG: Holliday junction branch migration protein RuvA [Patescibacteria group bacterium]|jgi:Holliday junction DNA helicase RuvA